MSISVTGIIGSITAGSIYANFDIAPTDPNAGYFRNITTTNGPFVGSLHSRAIWADAGSGTPGIYLNGGDLDADVRVEGAVYSTTQFQVLGTGKVLKPGRTLSFGLQYPASMEFADNGIQGQVVFNAAALTSPPYNQWSTTVKKNGVTLSPTPSYTAASATLGGGAVGLVPFRIHPTDSEPDQASTWTADTFPATVKIHHYGPIELSGSNPPVTIERQEYGVYPEPAWTSVDATGGPNNRELVITPNPNWFGCGYNYRIKPVAGGLKCRDIPANGSEADVYPWEYTFAIECAMGDLNLNGRVQLDDADLWIADPVDVDRNGSTDANDLLVILDNLE